MSGVPVIPNVENQTMNLRSLGYRTDLIFARFHGQVSDIGEAVCISHPASPTFYFGNLLVFRNPPRAGDRPRWEALFARHVGTPPTVRHRLFGWDVPASGEAELQDFLDAGYVREDNVVMSAPRLHRPPRLNETAEYRPLRDSDADWSQAVDNQVAAREDGYAEAGYRAFKESQFRGYRAMCRAGQGVWYGAFVGGELVADLGVFSDGAGVLRYQSVATHPRYRRRGLCASLTFFAGTHARMHFAAEQLVIVADNHAGAKRVYASVGFQDAERQVLLLRRGE